MRLLSHRPSVLYKVEHMATEPVDGDIAVEGLVLAGPAWTDRLKDLLGSLSQSERACLFAIRLADDQALPMPADTLLDRSRTDWFPDFLSHGQMKPHFQPIVELATGAVFGREALMRGKLGAVEVRGGELLAAAEAHDALFSFDYRARTAALEVGLPLLPDGEILFVNLDPRAVLDVEGSLRTTWPAVGRLGADPSRICLELVKPERCADRDMLAELVAAHRKRGALVALDDMSGGAESLQFLELLRPDVAKIDNALTAGIQHSPGAPPARGRAGRLRPRARLQGRRRGRRARRRVPGDGRPRRRPRPGLLLRPGHREADGGRHPPRPAARRSSLSSELRQVALAGAGGVGWSFSAVTAWLGRAGRGLRA